MINTIIHIIKYKTIYDLIGPVEVLNNVFTISTD